MHTVFALLCFVVVMHWLIVPYPSGLLRWQCGNLTIAPVPAKQPWWIWINTSCEFIMNDCITTTKQSTTKPCAYFLGYTVPIQFHLLMSWLSLMHSIHKTARIYVSPETVLDGSLNINNCTILIWLAIWLLVIRILGLLYCETFYYQYTPGLLVVRNTYAREWECLGLKPRTCA